MLVLGGQQYARIEHYIERFDRDEKRVEMMCSEGFLKLPEVGDDFVKLACYRGATAQIHRDLMT